MHTFWSEMHVIDVQTCNSKICLWLICSYVVFGCLFWRSIIHTIDCVDWLACKYVWMWCAVNVRKQQKKKNNCGDRGMYSTLFNNNRFTSNNVSDTIIKLLLNCWLVYIRTQLLSILLLLFILFGAVNFLLIFSAIIQ